MKQLHVRYILLSWTLSVLMYQISILINKKIGEYVLVNISISLNMPFVYTDIFIYQSFAVKTGLAAEDDVLWRCCENAYEFIYAFIYICVCIHMSTDWGRGGLWWPASSWYWLSHTGCRQCFLCTKWLMCGKTYIYPLRCFRRRTFFSRTDWTRC